MTDGRQHHALHVERCVDGDLVVDLVVINDQPWFAVAPEAAASAPQKDRLQREVTWPGGEKRPASLLSELGMYRVLLLSKSPTADDLMRWIFDEIVPAARKSGRFRLIQEAKRLGVHLDYTDDQWEWLKLNAYLVDVIPLALAGFDSIQITQALNYNTSSGITVRKQLSKLRKLGMIPQNIQPRIRQLEARIIGSKAS